MRFSARIHELTPVPSFTASSSPARATPREVSATHENARRRPGFQLGDLSPGIRSIPRHAVSGFRDRRAVMGILRPARFCRRCKRIPSLMRRRRHTTRRRLHRQASSRARRRLPMPPVMPTAIEMRAATAICCPGPYARDLRHAGLTGDGRQRASLGRPHALWQALPKAGVRSARLAARFTPPPNSPSSGLMGRCCAHDTPGEFRRGGHFEAESPPPRKRRLKMLSARLHCRL